ncbi:hypothetical protein PG995_000431 [Apiospora arundinis]
MSHLRGGDDAGVEIYTQKAPEALIRLLYEHLPHSLSLLRRLQFTKCPGGITEHARILYASDVALSSTLPGAGAAAGEAVATQASYPFTAAYLDISRGPETQMWMYSTLERSGLDGDNEDPPSNKEDNRQRALRHAVSILRTARRLLSAAVAASGWSASPLGPCILAGTLNEALRVPLQDECGIVFPHVGLHDKWLFDVREVQFARHIEGARLGPGMRWGGVRGEDLPWVLSRSDVPRQERTVKLLPSTAVLLEDGTPIAWSFLGPDAGLSGLHCEELYRGRGIAKAVGAKIMQDHLQFYGGDDIKICVAEVALDNLSSQGVCKSLGGKIGWTCSWSTIDLDTVPMK